MNAFWWYHENSIAGMGRPGFNRVHWFELPFDEAAAFGWLGQHSTGTVELESFRHHLRTYVPKIFKFHNIDEATGTKMLAVFATPAGIGEVFERLNKRTQTLETFAIDEDRFTFTMSEERLDSEITFLKGKGIRRVISLTERQHSRDLLKDHFALHHFSIEDLNAPRLEQVHELADVIKTARRTSEKIAVHCLAGIGRTSTMLLGAHIVLGEKFEALEGHIKKTNPAFVLTGPQAEFIQGLVS